MDKEQQRDLIERYLRGRMPTSEREGFEARLQLEPQLAEELRLSALADEAIRAYREDQQVKEWVAKGKKALQAQKGSEVEVPRINRYRSRWAAAATVLILVVASIFLFPLINKKSSPQGPDALYSAYFSPASTSGLLSGEPDSSETLRIWSQALRQYEDGRYAASAEGFQLALQDATFSRRSRAQLLLGISLMQTGRMAEAIPLLQSIPAEAADLRREAQWYTALAYLKAGELPQSRRILEELVADPAQPHREKALQLQRELAP